jgi:hypothetical protein
MSVSKLILVAAAFAAVSPSVHAQIWGIKSQGATAPSLAPANLFRLNEDGSGFTNFGAIQVLGAQIDADGLAASSVHGLMAFDLSTPGSSTLLSLSTSNAQGTRIGVPLQNREIRGAAFDAAERLWVLDNIARSIFRIDPTTGAQIPGSETPLSLPGAAFPDLQSGGDIAFNLAGQLTLVANNQIFDVNPLTGLASLLGTDPTVSPVNFLVGAAYSANAPADRLFAFEVNGTDDVVYYETNSSFVPQFIATNILGGFNAGRGDLATVIPAPASLMVLAAGLFRLRRRR